MYITLTARKMVYALQSPDQLSTHSLAIQYVLDVSIRTDYS